MDFEELFQMPCKGVMATANAKGEVNAAVYARPHIINDVTLAWGMTEGRTYKNLRDNPYACYPFIPSKGFAGVRLGLKINLHFSPNTGCNGVYARIYSVALGRTPQHTVQYASGSSPRTPCIFSRLHRFASISGEKFRLGDQGHRKFAGGHQGTHGRDRQSGGGEGGQACGILQGYRDQVAYLKRSADIILSAFAVKDWSGGASSCCNRSDGRSNSGGGG